jgi:hypothetical protein
MPRFRTCVAEAQDALARQQAFDSAEQEAIASEDRRRLLAALARLPPRRREVLVPRYYLGAWQNLAVDHISAVNGSLIGLDYYRSRVPVAEGVAEEIFLSPDPSGRYLLFSYPGPGGETTGWIGGGRFHPLPVRQPYLGFLIDAW